MRPMVGRRALALLFLLGTSCAAGPGADVSGLGDQPPREFSVLVTGGAFLDSASVVQDASEFASTFRGTPREEPVSLEDLVSVLRRSRVFTRIDIDRESDANDRAHIAAVRGHMPLRDARLSRMLERARGSGHDYLLVVQYLSDGPVEAYGVNDRWPLTLGLWLVVGLGALIPDHTYESRALLNVALHEVHTGRQVYRTAESGGPVELSLFGRANAWGLVQSLLVPPFWVASSPDKVVRQVREAAMHRILDALARQLKGVACRQRLTEEAAATIQLSRVRGGVSVGVRARDGISFVRMRVDDRLVEGENFDRFERRFLDSGRATADGFDYSGELAVGDGRLVQVLLQTVTGRVASATFDVETL